MKLSELIEVVTSAATGDNYDEDIKIYSENGDELEITDIVSRKSIIKETTVIEMELSIK